MSCANKDIATSLPSPPPPPVQSATNAHRFRVVSELLAGATSGAVAAILTAPLDLAKTRMQVQYAPKCDIAASKMKRPVRYRSLTETLRRTLSEEGTRGLFKGLGSTVIGLVPNWAIYFASYGRAKSVFSESFPRWSSDEVHFSSAIAAGTITTCATNPLWLIKVRLQTQFSGPNHQPKYRNIRHAFVRIFQEEGMRGFYKGLPASLMGLAHVAIQFPLYERLKEYYDADVPGEHLNFYGVVMASSLSKLVASSVTYPHEVVRSRFQRQSTNIRYTSICQCVRKIWMEEGVKAFFSGISANLIRVVPACAATFASFEYTLRGLDAILH